MLSCGSAGIGLTSYQFLIFALFLLRKDRTLNCKRKEDVFDAYFPVEKTIV